MIDIDFVVFELHPLTIAEYPKIFLISIATVAVQKLRISQQQLRANSTDAASCIDSFRKRACWSLGLPWLANSKSFLPSQSLSYSAVRLQRFEQTHDKPQNCCLEWSSKTVWDKMLRLENGPFKVWR